MPLDTMNAAAQPQLYDCIIIGAGQAGVPLAKAFAQAGKHTALVERLHVGGTCINEGCTPTKTMIASAEVAYMARRAPEYGITTGHVRVDMEEVRRRKRNLVERFLNGTVESLKAQNGLDLIIGHAHFVDERLVEVLAGDGTTRCITAPTIVINTGGRPHMPLIPGIETVTAYDSTTIMELGEVPEHLIILGGGYIACEFAQMFKRFGSRVTMIERGAQLLGREDKDIAKAVLEILRQDGIRVLLGSDVTCLQKGTECCRVTINSGGMELPVEGSHLLIAVGRTPNSNGLGLDAAGVKVNDRGHIEVNDQFQTAAPGIFAVGDVTGVAQFTHVSYDDFRILRKNLLERGDSARAGRLIPYTVFMDPELGRIGIGEDEARKQGLNIKVARMEMSSVARADEMGRTRGMLKVVIDADTLQILGCACLGLSGGELMSMIEIAMMGKLPYTALRDGIFAHPTLAESLNNLFESVE